MVRTLLVASLALAGTLAPHPAAAQSPIFSVPNSEPAVSDSTFPWRDCGTFDIPLGSIRPSLGTVAYRMGRDGRADTATLRIVAAERISVAGYRSAVTRVLASCRMGVPRGLPREGVPVVQVIRFGGIGVMPHAARPTDSLLEGLPDDPVLLPTQGLPLAHDTTKSTSRSGTLGTFASSSVTRWRLSMAERGGSGTCT